jgi:Tfp pilus assembly protein PilN
MAATPAVRKFTNTAVDIASASAARLRGAWGPLKKMLAFSPADDLIAPQKRLAVSLEKGGVSVVYGSRFLSKIRIAASRKYSSEEGRYPQPEDLASFLALAANELGAAGTDVSLSIPKAWAIIKTAEFPSTVKENLPDVMSFEMDRLTPFMPDEAFFDFRVLKEQEGRLTLLLMAAKAEMVRPYIAALNEHGFNVGALTVDISCLGTLCSYGKGGSDTIFVRVDQEGCEGALFMDGLVAQSFSSAVPASDTEALIDRFAAGIASLADTAKGRARNPQVVALIPDSDPSLKESIKLRLNLPIKFLGETDLGLIVPGGRQNVPYAAVGSLLESLWPKSKGLNLLKSGRYETPKTPAGLTVILILAIFVVGALNAMAPLRLEKERLQTITRQLGLKKKEAMKVEGLKKELNSVNGEISTITNFKQDNPVMLNLLKELTVILPKTTWLTRVRITDTTVQIEGYSDSATSLLPKLEASPYLQKVEFASPTFRDRRMNADRFNIKMEIEGLRKAEAEGGKKEIKTGNEKK